MTVPVNVVSGDAEGGRNGTAAVDHGQQEAAAVSNVGADRVFTRPPMLTWSKTPSPSGAQYRLEVPRCSAS